MTKAIKIILIVYGAISVVVGVIQAFFPDLVATIHKLGEMPAACDPGMYALAMSGVSCIAGGIFLLIAGTRDIVRNILWVQFALLWSILTVAISVYTAFMGYVTFAQTMMPIIINSVVFILLMIFYPWGRTEE